jgi:hypothetical protein
MNCDYGYVCFAYSKNEWIAKAIAFITGSKWSHTFLIAPPILDREMAMEASAEGVAMVPFDIAYRTNPNESYEVYRFKIPNKSIDGSILKTMDMLETPYGYAEFFWFIWRAINKKLGRDIRKNNNWFQQGTICSGLVRLYIENAGLACLFSSFGKDSANQQDVYEVVKKNPSTFELIETKS